WLAQRAAGVGVVRFSSGSCAARRVVLRNAQSLVARVDFEGFCTGAYFA
ncbi:hypothetical protein A2U01_0090358, partial [Trifolium medium]|nr:hypothetical protein [Trifolium medium]